jgi:peptide/nickel transport system ATP-binding protein
MYAGHVVETAPTEELFGNPRHPYTVGLLNSIPRLDAPRGEKLSPVPGSVADNLPWDSACAFGPRCPNVLDVCTQERPEWDGDQVVGYRCFNPMGGQR